MPAAFDGLAIAAIGRGGFGPEIFRERLFVGAVGHAGGAENEIVEKRGEGFSGDVHEKSLQDDEPAAGIAPKSAGDYVDADGLGVGGFFAVEDLHDGGKRLARGVAGEAVDGEAGVMAEDAADGDFFFFGESVFGDFPSAKLDVDVFIEAELAFLNEAKRGEGGDGLADRSSLEERFGSDRLLGGDVGEAVGASPEDLAAVEKSDADAGNFVVLHAAGDGHRLGRLAFDDDGGEKAVFDAGDASGFRLRLRRACGDDCAERMAAERNASERGENGETDQKLFEVLAHGRKSYHYLEGEISD